jgi:hypothetical protein
LPGKAQIVIRYPGTSSTISKERSERLSCRDAGEKWATAMAKAGTKTDANRCQGGGQANLIFSSRIFHLKLRLNC